MGFDLGFRKDKKREKGKTVQRKVITATGDNGMDKSVES